MTISKMYGTAVNLQPITFPTTIATNAMPLFMERAGANGSWSKPRDRVSPVTDSRKNRCGAVRMRRIPR